jgi:hypothetical protein
VFSPPPILLPRIDLFPVLSDKTVYNLVHVEVYTPQETVFDYSVHFELDLFLLPD